MKLPLEYLFLLLFPLVLVLPLPLLAGSSALTLSLLNVLVVAGVRGEWRKISFKELSKNVLVLFGVLVIVLDMFTHVLRNLDFEFIIRDVRISFFVVPVVMWLIKDRLHSLRTPLLFSLVLGVVLYILYAYGYLTYFYTDVIRNRSFEFNHYLIYDLRENIPGVYHHSYIGMYMTFAIGILLHYAKKKYQMLFLGMAFFILLNQVVFGSKLTVLFSVVLVTFYFPKFLKKQVRPRALFGIFVVITLIITLLVYKSGLLNSLSFSTSNRIESWRCTIQGFFEKPIFGHGHEASVSYLENCMTSDAISAHSQYFEELMNYGLFGLWLPIFFALLFFKTNTDGLFKVFLLLIATVSCFENTLSLQRGVLFFTFFVSMFILQKGTEKPKTRFD